MAVAPRLSQTPYSTPIHTPPATAFQARYPANKGESRVPLCNQTQLTGYLMAHLRVEVRCGFIHAGGEAGQGRQASTAPPGPPPTGMLAFIPKLPPLPTNNAGIHAIHGGGDHKSFLQITVIPAI